MDRRRRERGRIREDMPPEERFALALRAGEVPEAARKAMEMLNRRAVPDRVLRALVMVWSPRLARRLLQHIQVMTGAAGVVEEFDDNLAAADAGAGTLVFGHVGSWSAYRATVCSDADRRVFVARFVERFEVATGRFDQLRVVGLGMGRALAVRIIAKLIKEECYECCAD